jgi:hypothetical protein
VEPGPKSKPNGAIAAGSGQHVQRFLNDDAFRTGTAYQWNLALLSQLKALHDELRLAIAELATEVGKSAPDLERLPMVRLNLNRLSGRRKSLIECSIAPLLHDAFPEDARRIADLRYESAGIAVATSTHIARWTMRQIVSDWPGYQRASAEMRRAMLRRIDREAAVFYPLLEAESGRHAA